MILGIAGVWPSTCVAHGARSPGPAAVLPSLELPDICHAQTSGRSWSAPSRCLLVAFSDSSSRHAPSPRATTRSWTPTRGAPRLRGGPAWPKHPGRGRAGRAPRVERHGGHEPGRGLAAAGTIVGHAALPHRADRVPLGGARCGHRVRGGQADRPGAVARADPQQQVEVVIAAVRVVCVVAVGVLQAIIVAVLLSVADIVRRAARPADAVLGWSAHDDRYVDVADQPTRASARVSSSTASRTGCSSPTPTTSSAGCGPPWTVRPNPCGTWCSTARSSATSTPALRSRCARCSTAPRAQHRPARRAGRRGLRGRLDSVGLVEAIGADHFHGTVTAAVQACTH